MSEIATRLDEAKVETLRSWGEGLRAGSGEELRAAGRAITMLVEEIERLNIDLWHAHTESPPMAGVLAATDEPKQDAQPAVGRRRLPSPLPAFWMRTL